MGSGDPTGSPEGHVRSRPPDTANAPRSPLHEGVLCDESLGQQGLADVVPLVDVHERGLSSPTCGFSVGFVEVKALGDLQTFANLGLLSN